MPNPYVDFGKVLTRHRQVLAEDLVDAARVGVAVAQRNSPFRTGRLRRDIRIIERPTSTRLSVRFGNTSRVPYAIFQNFGTRFIRGRRYIQAGHRAAINYLKQRGYR